MSRGLKDILEYEGLRSARQKQGGKAFTQLAEKAPDCLILDLMLPDMSGYEVCEQNTPKKLNTPILMLTAKAQEYEQDPGIQGRSR